MKRMKRGGREKGEREREREEEEEREATGKRGRLKGKKEGAKKNEGCG